MKILPYLVSSNWVASPIGFENNRQFMGLKLASTPGTHPAYPVSAEGYYLRERRNFVVGKAAHPAPSLKVYRIVQVSR